MPKIAPLKEAQDNHTQLPSGQAVPAMIVFAKRISLGWYLIARIKINDNIVVFLLDNKNSMCYYKTTTMSFLYVQEVDAMPKVKNEYLENKRNQILDAAFAVCKKKPAYDITMTDIVSETGMSQGGVYKYFNNIDLVLAALIDKANMQGNHVEQIDEIMKSGNSPEVILHDLFLVSEQYFSDILIGYNKVLFELSAFWAHNEEHS